MVPRRDFSLKLSWKRSGFSHGCTCKAEPFKTQQFNTRNRYVLFAKRVYCVITEKGQSPGTETRLRWRKDQTQWRQANEQQDR